MKLKLTHYGIILYGLMVWVGGFIGFFKAGSVVSLAAGTAAGLGLLFAAVYMATGKKVGKWLALIISVLLVVFFSYRLLVTHNLMPAGIIILMGLWLIVRLISNQEQNRS